MQLGEKWSALRPPCQDATGWGARQRRCPTGGAAKGMPLNATMDASLPGTPETCPPVTFTGWRMAAPAGRHGREKKKATGIFCLVGVAENENEGLILYGLL